MGTQQGPQLYPDFHQHRPDAKDLQTSGGRTGTAAPSGQEQQNDRRQSQADQSRMGRIPASGQAGDHRHAIVVNVAAPRPVAMPHIPQHQNRQGQRHHAQIPLDLSIGHQHPQISAQGGQQNRKGQTGQKHSEGDDQIDGGLVIMIQAVLPSGGPTAGDHPHGMDDRVQIGHARQPQHQCQNPGQSHIKSAQSDRQAFGASGGFQHGKGIHPVKPHSANPQIGQNGNPQGQGPASAQPLDDTPPQRQAGRKVRRMAKNGAARGGEAGHTFKHRIGQAGVTGTEDERQCRCGA